MQYTTLNNGIKMPMVGFGVFQIHDAKTTQTVVEEAIKTGYRLIDTAQVYGNEEAVGKAIKASGVPREELFITTKLWISDFSYEAAKDAFNESLRKLDLDYIDLYLLHQPFGDIFGAWRALEELYKEGKIKAIGVSNFKPDQLANLAAFNEVTPAVNQIELHVFNQKEDEQAYMLSKGVQTESWGAFAEGQFDVFNNPVLKEIAEKYSKTTAQVMLRWQLQRGIVSLSKSANPERVRQNFDIFDFELSAEDMDKIATLNTNTTVFSDHHEAKTVELLASFVGKSF
ncbi:aldo/keto reductase [Streptococcus ruminantium]|uniref:aldo/keto reductase n=1 Tax=Streptococcus ruminantium TaxID=1917441 RepID=UPI00280C752E|nr:aldo/keto reductase [Streptococcus ruminantium]MDQ8769176.1 aldo/keto reductase [Streptococcus ruminantium]MDQ8793546.1 aldo/keto reductase [Streptococcus ruminantium]MDQ8795060.1 aldo/keto reductase [Streptococcus ruminantium]MDQ8817595.1 aldo/keto reductase [Streptococcus ruminantium]MDQ8834440.1 aldo/keto reductase [Streptococcus ruminantium]